MRSYQKLSCTTCLSHAQTFKAHRRCSGRHKPACRGSTRYDPDRPSRQNCANCGRPAQKSYFGRHTCTDRRDKRARTVQSATIGTPFDLRAALVSRLPYRRYLVLQMRGLRLKCLSALALKARQPTRHRTLHLLARAMTRLLSRVPQTCEVTL